MGSEERKSALCGAFERSLTGRKFQSFCRPHRPLLPSLYILSLPLLLSIHFFWGGLSRERGVLQHIQAIPLDLFVLLGWGWGSAELTSRLCIREVCPVCLLSRRIDTAHST